jgi:hypothetical protein
VITILKIFVLKNQPAFMWCRALARGNITVLGILRAEALHHIKAVLLKLGIFAAMVFSTKGISC